MKGQEFGLGGEKGRGDPPHEKTLAWNLEEIEDLGKLHV
jgi:hypothetical protein